MQTPTILLSAATAGALALFGAGVAVLGPFAVHSGNSAASPAAAPSPSPNSPRTSIATGHINADTAILTTSPSTTAPSTTGKPSGTGSLATPNITAASAMIAALTSTSHDVTMKTSSSMVRGSVDPASGTAHAVATSSGLEISEVVSRGKVFVEANLGKDFNEEVGIKPGTWMRLNPAQISSDNELLVQPDGSDPVDMPGIMSAVTAIHQVDATHLAGTLDLTRITGHTKPDPDQVKKAGAAAKKVPFTITADALGRVTNFHVNANAFDPILSVDVTYSHYGSGAATATPPASVTAPENVYSLFNN